VGRPLAARPTGVGPATRRLRIRPLGPADFERYSEFVHALDKRDVYLRTMGRAAPPDAGRIRTLLEVDGRTCIALAAVDRAETILGVARAAVQDNESEGVRQQLKGNPNQRDHAPIMP
jgi:hypothetical protein